MKRKFGDAWLILREGDLTLEDADAIVNAANPSLLGGGGVDGAIHRRGGLAILEECRRIRERLGRPLAPGEAVMTTGGQLKARHVIHTVGPVYDRHPDPEGCLRSAYVRSLELAAGHGLRTLAFPSIATGAYGFPICLAAPIALRTVRDHLLAGGSSLVEVRFVLFGADAYNAYETSLVQAGRES
jgi:O-acetyl-ADP-ribose deacetylase (regulator of RNase III)